jgi:hypothetical protein
MNSKNVRSMLYLTIMSSIVILKVSGQTTRPEPPTMLRIQTTPAQPVLAESTPMMPEPELIQPLVPTNPVPVQPLVPADPAPIQPVVPAQPVPIQPMPADPGLLPPPASPALIHQKD